LGGTESKAWDINESGQVVGWASRSDDWRHATLWNNGVATDLGPTDLAAFYGRWDSEARGINDSGQVVGWTSADGYGYHATLWSNGVATELGALWWDSQALGINNSGQVVGRSNYFDYSSNTSDYSWDPSSTHAHAMLWTSADGMIDLNSLLGANSGFSYLVEASAINDKGQIVGYGLNAAGQQRPFLMTPTGSPVPVPGAVWLLGSGIAGLAGLRRSRRNA
jgi:probable HAF family extracellular repeat protein